MTPEQIKLIKLSFVPLMSRKRDAGKIFYQRLFEVAPETKAMFKSDINAQAEKLMSMLGMIISSLHDNAALRTMLGNLGERHRGYGATEEHYAKVCTTLLWTLEQLLGDAFTAEAKTAWTELYAAVGAMMRNPDAKGSAADSKPRAVANF